MIKNILFVVLIGIGCLTFQSCSPIHRVQIDSISKPEACLKNRYLLVPGNQNCDSNDLQFCEFATYADRALMHAGFVKANCPENADVMIYLFYSVSDPETYQYTYTLPVYGQTGYSASTTCSSVNYCGNSAYGCSTTNYTPTYGVVGSSMHIGTAIRYQLSLGLFAYERHMQGSLWETKAFCWTPTGDLRFMFPVLLGATEPYIGRNTGMRVEVDIAENDERIQRIKGICDGCGR